MNDVLAPLKTESLKEVFIARFEELILSGQLQIGEKLPGERELALQLGVSRPVVHEGLVELSYKGLVSLTPRVGTVINDYRREGSLALLTSLVGYRQGNFDPQLLRSLLDVRRTFELETARLAARQRTAEHLTEFADIIALEASIDVADTDALAELDFRFHHLIAIASGNMIYPLLLNSFKQVYTNLTGRFFAIPGVTDTVFALHAQIVKAVRARSAKKAVDLMTGLLAHGEQQIRLLETAKVGRKS